MKRIRPQVLGGHRHSAEASGVREAGQSAAADQLLGQHSARHVSLPQVSGFGLRLPQQTGHPGGELRQEQPPNLRQERSHVSTTVGVPVRITGG